MTRSQLTELEIPTLLRPFGTTDSQKTYPEDFGVKYAIPASAGGTLISRHEMNGLGYLATIGSFLDRLGYQYEWQDMSSVGGYPEGAVVSHFDGSRLRQYISIEDNNTNQPVMEGEVSDTSTEQNGWRPLFTTKEYNFFPNYDSATLVSELVVTASTPLNRRAVSVSEPGWLLITRSIDNWEDVNETYGTMTFGERLAFSEANYVMLSSWASNDNVINSDTDLFTLFYNEGRTASRLIPSKNGVLLTSKCASPVTSITIRVYRFDMEA